MIPYMAKKHSPSPIADALRGAILESGMTPYAVAKRAGVEPSNMYKFLDGEVGMLLTSLERIVEVLDLEVTIKPRKRGRR